MCFLPLRMAAVCKPLAPVDMSQDSQCMECCKVRIFVMPVPIRCRVRREALAELPSARRGLLPQCQLQRDTRVVPERMHGHYHGSTMVASRGLCSSEALAGR